MIRMQEKYVLQDGTLNQAGYSALHDAEVSVAALDARLTTAETDIATIETATSFVKLQTVVTAASQTSIDFTGVPSWANRITLVFAGFSTNGTSLRQVQIGNGAFVTSGYTGGHGAIAAGSAAGGAITSGFAMGLQNLAADTFNGTMTISRLTGNTWVAAALGASAAGNIVAVAGGSIALGGALDRVRVTTVIGTQTFDAGSVNISWE